MGQGSSVKRLLDKLEKLREGSDFGLTETRASKRWHSARRYCSTVTDSAGTGVTCTPDAGGPQTLVAASLLDFLSDYQDSMAFKLKWQAEFTVQGARG